jgi:hypothetical protein
VSFDWQVVLWVQVLEQAQPMVAAVVATVAQEQVRRQVECRTAAEPGSSAEVEYRQARCW